MITPSNQLSYVMRIGSHEQNILISGDAGFVDFKDPGNKPYHQALIDALSPLHVVQVKHHGGNNGYQPQLGLPWFELGAIPIYRPWALFAWWYSLRSLRTGSLGQGGDEPSSAKSLIRSPLALDARAPPLIHAN